MGTEMYDAMAPYCGSVELSLAAAQREIFESGDFEEPELFEGNEMEVELEMLVGLAPESETYSLLDVRGVSKTPCESHSAAFSSDELVAFFGTSKPTEDQFAEHEDLDDLWQGERGHCRHVVLYRDGKPDKVYFWGWSYD
jgi:hypothetical protein